MNQNLSIQGVQNRAASYGQGVDGLRAEIRTLVEAVRRGDLQTATATHGGLSDHPAAQGKGPVRGLLDSLRTPLEDGDIDAARDALAALRATRSEAPPIRPRDSDNAGRHEREKVREAVRNLIEALRGDELDSAQLAYAQLVELSDVEERGLNGPFSMLLTDIGEAVAAGDPDGANDLFAAFVRRLSPGSAVDQSA